jgi:hypothetical protein
MTDDRYHRNFNKNCCAPTIALFMSTQQLARDPWPQEREGYYEPPRVADPPLPHGPSTDRESTLIRRSEEIGSLVAGGGIIWTAYAVAHHSAEILRFAIFPPGPLEVLGVGVLIWLVAKACRGVMPY